MKAVIAVSTSVALSGLFIAGSANAQLNKETCYESAYCYSVPVGSPQIDASRLLTYHARWTQQFPKDGGWEQAAGGFEERLQVDESGQWKHIQIALGPDGPTNIGTRTLDKKTLQVYDETLQFKNRPPEHPAKVHIDLSGDEYSAEVTYGNGETKKGQPQQLPIPMFDGQILGVAISALPLAEGFTASLPALLAHTSSAYWVEAKVVARKEIATADGGTQDVWEVATKWVDHQSGDISEAGRNEAGGAYYIAVKPGNGIPHVIEYTNNGVSIVWDGVRRTGS